VTSAGTIRGHLARLLLLACTVLGVAALHTIGHALSDVDHYGRVPAVVDGAVAALTAPGDHGGCDGDGCTHHLLAPTETGAASRWWEACLALLMLAVGTIMRVHTGTTSRAAIAPRPPPRTFRRPPIGLTLTAVVVLRT
jgi:hypothetical protein